MVRSQHALIVRLTFTTIATLLIEMAGFRRQNHNERPKQLGLIGNAT